MRRVATRGRGDYWAPLRRATKGYAPRLGRAIGAAGGAALGNVIAPGIGGSVGSMLGSSVGEAAGSVFRHLTGWGDYQVKSNTILHPNEIVPSFGPDTIRVRKREYICDITASEAFSNNNFPVNPGLDGTFPWLSSIANNYEQYRWNGLIFEYISQSTVSLATTDTITLGTVAMASDYNAIDPAYVNMPQMLSTMFSNSGRPSNDIAHAVECAPTDTPNKLYYIRSGDQPEGSDLRLYDMLSFQIGVKGMPAATEGQAIGQLWVNYDITLCKSVQNNQVGFDINTDYWRITAFSDTAPLGTSQLFRGLRNGSNIGTTINSDNATIEFPPIMASGYYLFCISWLCGSSTAPTIVPDTKNCTVLAGWPVAGDNFTGNGGGTQSGSTTTRIINLFVVRIDDRDASVTIDVTGTFTSPDCAVIYITQMNGEIFESPDFD